MQFSTPKTSFRFIFYLNPLQNFLLIGNGSYLNRGCEAIIRGTMKILRSEFGGHVQSHQGVVCSPDTLKAQAESETDTSVHNFAIPFSHGPRWSIPWLISKLNSRLGTSIYPHVRALNSPSKLCSIALEVGGDNYSLDYGRPDYFMAMDRYLRDAGLPVAIWGASIGPFDKDPGFIHRVISHLLSLDGIFLRETASYEYLLNKGLSKNLHLVADPAFVMDASLPSSQKLGFTIPVGCIGINISPLIGFFSKRNKVSDPLKHWKSQCVELLNSAASFNRPIVLIPHVQSTEVGNDDFSFLNALYLSCAHNSKVPLFLAPSTLTAPELKGLIASCSVFIGARTHSTIAALSSGVPTLSIAYSLKATGINRDVYGSLDYCIQIDDLTPALLADKMQDMLINESSIRRHLAYSIPKFQDRAMEAGPILRTLLMRTSS